MTGWRTFWRVAPVLATVLLVLASCGNARSDEEAMAARGRASLMATFTDTSWRLPPMTSSECETERQNGVKARDTYARYEVAIYCSLNSSAMTHLLQRLDQGLGTDVTETQKTCINGKVTRNQIAALLATRVIDADDRAVRVAEFDDQLASSIRQCTRN